MIFEAAFGTDDDEPKDPLNLYVLFILAIATSIDALAVGITFSFLDVSIYTPILVIGAVTFVMSVAGAYIGNKLGHAFNEKYLEALGGLILIGIGVKIVLEHTILA
jgi:putative Mn2+ efflux pump MntP